MDERWYWATPFLFDFGEDADACIRLARPGERLRGLHGDGGARRDFARHIESARWLAPEVLGRPPDDLVATVARLRSRWARASLRFEPFRESPAGRHHSPSRPCATEQRESRGSPYLVQPSRGDRPGATTEGLLEGRARLLRSRLPSGTLDEYAHVLVEWLGFVDREPAEVAARLRTRCTTRLLFGRLPTRSAISTPTVRRSFSGTDIPSSVRSSLQEHRIDEERDSYRPTLVREAFNSPFWPFVFATTSVGQEGSDFHLYCHSVVTGTCPANPVDLDSGRDACTVQGHAIRKNLAAVYSGAAFTGRTAILGGRSSTRLRLTVCRGKTISSRAGSSPTARPDRTARTDPSV